MSVNFEPSTKFSKVDVISALAVSTEDDANVTSLMIDFALACAASLSPYEFGAVRPAASAASVQAFATSILFRSVVMSWPSAEFCAPSMIARMISPTESGPVPSMDC